MRDDGTTKGHGESHCKHDHTFTSKGTMKYGIPRNTGIERLRHKDRESDASLTQ